MVFLEGLVVVVHMDHLLAEVLEEVEHRVKDMLVVMVIILQD